MPSEDYETNVTNVLPPEEVARIFKKHGVEPRSERFRVE